MHISLSTKDVHVQVELFESGLIMIASPPPPTHTHLYTHTHTYSLYARTSCRTAIHLGLPIPFYVHTLCPFIHSLTSSLPHLLTIYLITSLAHTLSLTEYNGTLFYPLLLPPSLLLNTMELSFYPLLLPPPLSLT